MIMIVEKKIRKHETLNKEKCNDIEKIMIVLTFCHQQDHIAVDVKVQLASVIVIPCQEITLFHSE